MDAMPLALRALGGLVVVSALAGCGEGRTSGAPMILPRPPLVLPLPAGVPDTLAGHHLAWFLDLMNRREGVMSGVEASARLHAVWFARKALVDVMFDFHHHIARRFAPVYVDSVVTVDEWRLIAYGEARRLPVTLRLTVDLETTQIRGLSIEPDLDARSFEEIERMIPNLAPQANLLVAELVGEECRPLHAVNPDLVLSIASTFKLYVLLALVDHIAAGHATWDTPLVIREEWRSQGSGDMHGDPAGTRHSLLMLARAMIDGSDNTATDHLIYYLGRGAIAEAMMAAQHAAPERNVPFVSTREYFFLRAFDGVEMRRYLELSPEGRRAFVDAEIKPRPVAALPGVDGKPVRHVDEVGWFASAMELCRVMATLEARARASPENEVLLDILSDTRTPNHRGRWSFLGYKGGGSPGVDLNTWVLHRADDRRFFVTVGFNNRSRVAGTSSRCRCGCSSSSPTRTCPRRCSAEASG